VSECLFGLLFYAVSAIGWGLALYFLHREPDYNAKSKSFTRDYKYKKAVEFMENTRKLESPSQLSTKDSFACFLTDWKARR